VCPADTCGQRFNPHLVTRNGEESEEQETETDRFPPGAKKGERDILKRSRALGWERANKGRHR
jgi:hypothetical protein